MLTAQLAKTMGDEHLLAAARAEADPLTSTALELELIERFETLLNETAKVAPIAKLLDEYEVGADDLRAVMDSHPANLKDQAALLSMLNDQDIHEPEQLKGLIDLASEFRALANDAEDFVDRLHNLFATIQE